MSEWTRVKWTEARQIAEALGDDADGWPAPEVTPQQQFQALRKDGSADDALYYLGQALPRFEAVAWAAREIERQAKAKPSAPLQRQALDRVLRWVDEPTDDYRRAALEAAERARSDSPEHLLGQAVFMSGGSIAPPDLPAVIPPHHVCGNLAATAVLVACHRDADPAAAKQRALDAGDRVACDGLQALSPA